MKKLFFLLAVAALVCLSCVAMAAGDSIAFDPGVSSINEGETLQTALIREGEAAAGELTYSSSDKRVATVDENGLVTAVKKGRAVITAMVKAEKKTWKAQLKLTVVRPVTSVSVKTDRLPVYAATDGQVAPFLTERENAEENELPVLLLPVKKKYQLQVAVEPRDASNRNVTFASSDEAVFTASKAGVAGVAPGEGILTVASETNPEVLTRFRVLVVQPVTRLTITSSAPTVTVGQQITVNAIATPENATMKDVIWSSGDERILTVDANGVVTGVKRGNGRIIATAKDGSNTRANISIRVVQNPERITLAAGEITVDVGRNTLCKATVEPRDADNKKVSWTSSDERIATVDKNGRIKGNAVGECTITCISDADAGIFTSLTVHVQQPVTRLAFTAKSAAVYVDETIRLTWNIEPANATNPTLTFKSSNDRVATVDENGLVTARSSGKVTITAMTTDGSRRKATIAVQTGRHVTGVRMIRKRAYIDKGETATAGANIEPRDALNRNMTWESSNPNIVRTNGNTNQKMRLTAVSYGDAVVTGTTEDGGYQASIRVTVGDFDHGLSFRSYDFDKKGNTWLILRNNTDYPITQITAELELWDASGEKVRPAKINTKNGSNKVQLVWTGVLEPGRTTGQNRWKMVDFKKPSCGMDMTRGRITVISYQIDHDWIKTIREKNRPYDFWE